MNHTPFITRPLSIALDAVRALAALAVLVGHAQQLGHYSGPWPFSLLFQHNAVIVFFVLSGLVIAASVDKGRTTLTSYTIARVSRILPVAVPALVLSVLVIGIDAAIAPTPFFGEDAQGFPGRDLLFALLFLSESYQTGMPMNPPYWSLCYEIWFYALFAAATYLTGWKRLGWIVALSALAGPNVLMLLPVWLMGVVLARLPALRALSPGPGAALVGLAIMAMYAVPYAAPALHGLLRLAIPWKMGFSLYALSDLILAVAIALGFAGLRAILPDGLRAIEAIERPVRWFANMSFSLYLLHWPLLKLARVLRAPDQGALGFVTVLIGIVVICGAFAAVTEHRRQAFRALIERALSGRLREPAAA